MKKALGWFELGGRKVHVTYDSKESGGHFTAHAITVGGASGDWGHVVGIACHEAMEKACADMELRYVPSHDEASASDGFLFVMRHDQFSEAVARVGWFLSAILPPLGKAFKDAKK